MLPLRTFPLSCFRKCQPLSSHQRLSWASFQSFKPPVKSTLRKTVCFRWNRGEHCIVVAVVAASMTITQMAFGWSVWWQISLIFWAGQLSATVPALEGGVYILAPEGGPYTFLLHFEKVAGSEQQPVYRSVLWSGLNAACLWKKVFLLLMFDGWSRCEGGDYKWIQMKEEPK